MKDGRGASPHGPGAYRADCMQGSSSSGGPIFIVGCSRSGTTLLHSILSQHEHLAAFPETNILPKVLEDIEFRRFGRIAISRRRIPGMLMARLRNSLGITLRFDWDRLTRDGERLRRLGGGKVSLPIPTGRRISIRRIYQEFGAFMNAAARGRRWVEKSPQNIYCIHMLDRYFQEATFVHMVREGTATVASLVDAGRKHDAFRSRFGRSDGVQRAVAFFNSSVNLTARFGHRPRHVVVRYEDLADDPRATATRLETFLGIRIDDKLLRYSTAGIVTAAEPWKDGEEAIRLRDSKFLKVLDDAERDYVRSTVVNVDKLFPRRVNR